MITLLLAWSLGHAAQPKVKPNYMIDGQTVSQLDAIKTLMRDPGSEVWQCQQVFLAIKDRSVSLTKKK